MMKFKYFLLFMLFVITPIIVNAKHEITNPLCTDNEKVKLREEALKVNYALEKYLDKATIYYKVTLINLNSNIKINYETKNYIPTSDKLEILNLLPGITMYLNLYAADNHVCAGYKIHTKILNIPYYNKFKDHELCKGNEEYFLCKENTSTKVTEEEFIRLINDYIKNKNKPVVENPNEEKPTTEEETSLNDTIIRFLIEYYIYILIGIIVLGTSGIIILWIRKRRSIQW